jgi:hypothetical protein
LAFFFYLCQLFLREVPDDGALSQQFQNGGTLPFISGASHDSEHVAIDDVGVNDGVDLQECSDAGI